MRQRISALVLIVVLVAADQLTKLVATHTWQSAPFVIWDGVLEFTYAQNTGAAWGMFAGWRWMLVAVTVVIVLAALILLMSGRLRHPMLRIAVALLIAGGVGNLIDRVAAGFVVDFIFVKCIQFPVFNFADCCVCIGAGLLLVYLLFFDMRSRGKERDGHGTTKMDDPGGTRGGAAGQVSVGDDGCDAGDGAEMDGARACDGERPPAE